MHDPIAYAAEKGGDPHQLQALRALEQQSAALSRLHAIVSDALDTIPVIGYSGWRGLAALAFDVALVSLRRDLATAVLRLDDAASDTRQALVTLRGRG